MKDTSTIGNQHYEQPDADQSERRRILKEDAEVKTMFAMAQGGNEGDALGRTPVVGARPFGPKLPAPQWSQDLAAVERGR
jgi:hypothetical protein